MNLNFMKYIKDLSRKQLFVGVPICGMVFSLYIVYNLNSIYGIILPALFAGVAVFFWRTIDGTDKKKISSEEWFRCIGDSLQDCRDAIVYLRDFDHPDKFDAKHREQLMRIMKLFARKIWEHKSRIRIVGFFPDKTSKDPRSWIVSELETENIKREDLVQIVDSSVILIESQPVANSATLYLIDNKIMIYNKKLNDGNMEYYVHIVDRTGLHPSGETGKWGQVLAGGGIHARAQRGYIGRWSAERKRALLGSNPPRNSRPETPCDECGAGGRERAGPFARGCHRRSPASSQ